MVSKKRVSDEPFVKSSQSCFLEAVLDAESSKMGKDDIGKDSKAEGSNHKDSKPKGFDNRTNLLIHGF